MALAKAPIPNSDYSVSRSCVMKVIDDLKRYTFMGDDVNILFPNDSQVVPTKGSTIHDTNRKVEYLTTDTIHVEVEEDTDPEYMLNIHTDGTNRAPVFYDREIDLRLHPIYYRHNVTLNIRYRSDSRSKAVNWRNSIKTRLASGAQFGLGHTLEFMFDIPKVLYNVMEHIHEIKERVVPTGEEFLDYFKRNSSKRLTSIHDPHGKFISLVYQESQTRVVGIYDLSEIPEKNEKDSDTSTYVATLTYKFHYMKPEYMTLKYPISVYNELIDEKYTAHLGKEAEYKLAQLAAVNNVALFNKFEMQGSYKTKDEVMGFARYPTFDDVELNKTFQGYKSIASFLISLDEDKKHLLNLKELGDFNIQKDVLKFIEEVEYKYMTFPYKSIFAISIQMDDKIFSFDNLILDDKLDLYAARELNIKKQYRVVIDICYQWYMLDRDAIDRLLRYPEAFEWILGAINAALKDNLEDIWNYIKDEPWYAKNHYTRADFNREIAILLDKASDESFYQGNNQGNNIFGNSSSLTNGSNILGYTDLTNKLLNLIRSTMRKTKTVFATSIIAYRLGDE